MTDREGPGRGLLVVSALAAAAVVWGGGTAASDSPPSPTTRPSGASVPIVLELFTSQGCSSCPPADEILSRLGEVAEEGLLLIPLAYHVDYWNRLGWADPFSSAEWSDRQAAYARVLEGGRLYTPQLVFNGRHHEVGSNGKRIETVLAEERQRPPAAEIQVAARRGSPAELTVEIEGEVTTASSEPLVLRIALWQSGLETEVPRGENARRKLANDYVVRRLESRRQPARSVGDRFSETVTMKVDPSWSSGQLGVAAFLQQRGSLAVTGAATARVQVP